jgi:hypothetical protein
MLVGNIIISQLKYKHGNIALQKLFLANPTIRQLTFGHLDA